MRWVIQCCGFLLALQPSAAGGQRLASSTLEAADISGSRVSERGRSGEQPGFKSEAVATWLSLSATLLPGVTGVVLLDGHSVVLPTLFIVSGLVVGPSAGHFYIGRPGGLMLRLGVAAATGAVVFGLSGRGGYDFGGLNALIGVVGAGGLIVLFDGLYDISRVGAAVRRYNAKRATAQPTLGLAMHAVAGRVGLGMRLEF